MRKLELNRLFTHGKTQLAPIAIDGRCNVFQHISALTKDSKIAPLVGTTYVESEVDIYTWFSGIVIDGMLADKGNLEAVYTEFHEKDVDMRGLVKLPVMTFPYGSTEFNIRKHLAAYLAEQGALKGPYLGM